MQTPTMLVVAIALSTLARAEPDAGVIVTPFEREQLRRVLHDHQHRVEVRRCYEQAFARHEQLSGTLVLEWDIVETGAVDHVHLAERSNLSSDAVALCVMQVIAGWQFPRIAAGGRVHLTYPFRLEFRGGDSHGNHTKGLGLTTKAHAAATNRWCFRA